MPNTLIHIALQAPLSRAVFPKVEIPWILLGVLIPDIPWIVQRITLMTEVGDPFFVRLYCTIQASLPFSLLLCLACASMARRVAPVFALLAFSSLLHLVLDALQIKWGNGVLFFAPFQWQTTRLGLLWPEHPVGYILAVLGILYLLWKGKTIVREGVALRRSPWWPALVPALVLYLLLPPLFMGTLKDTNVNYLKIIGESGIRSGSPIELDRSYYNAETDTITLFTGESVAVTGSLPPHSGTVSFKGEFRTPSLINSTRYHVHNRAYRDYASIAAIILTALIWTYILLNSTYHANRLRKRS